jgi:alpha-tubulin suppressor-like RCC1 family protein
MVAAGSEFVCAVLTDNTSLVCWGYNLHGQLGYGHTEDIGDNEPVRSAGFVQWQAPLPTPSVTPSVAATPSKSPSTASSPSMSAAATVSASPSKSSSASPTPVLPLQIAQVYAGFSHTCILTNNGSAMCWGINSDGQLGYGHSNNVGDDELPFAAGFVNTGSVPIGQLACGYGHTCALTTNGSVLCWGSNSLGQLGYGHTSTIGDDEVPATAGYVRLPAAVVAVQVVVGQFHSCALAPNGSVACWGYNREGELGLGHNNSIGDAVLPSSAGFVKLGGVAVTRLGSGPIALHTCALVANGSAICWGWNVYGQLGYGHTNSIGDNDYPSSAGFVNSGSLAAFDDIGAGYYHTCGLYTNKNVK